MNTMGGFEQNMSPYDWLLLEVLDKRIGISELAETCRCIRLRTMRFAKLLSYEDHLFEG